MSHHQPAPENGGGADEDADELYNTEFLDLLQSSDDAAALSALSQTDRGTRAAAAGQTPEGQQPRESAFLVGGSLFTDKMATRPAVPRDWAMTPRLGLPSPPNLLRTPPRHKTVFLAFGSLFCPFTRQFFAVRSPHWDHLRRVGFGINGTIRGGRCVGLLYPALLLRAARALQQTPVETEAQVASQPVREHFARSNCDTTAQWSPLLSRTLGALLKRAPVDSIDTFTVFINRHIKANVHGVQGRQIPLSLLASRRPGVMSPSSSQWHKLDWTHLASECKGAQTTDDGAPDRSVRCADSTSHKSRMTFSSLGQQWLDAAVADRSWQLQTHKRTEPLADHTPAAAPAVVRSTASSAAAAAPSAFSTDLRDKLSTSSSQTLRGMPPYTRVAWLRLPMPRDGAHISCSSSLMYAVCGALLLDQHQPPANGESLSDGGRADCAQQQQLLFCPVEHAVDYNSVMDLVAHRVLPDASTGLVDWLPNDPADRSPVLSLGLVGRDAAQAHPRGAGPRAESHPRQGALFVVVGNAHMLSRRAVSRMLDQWTRNGAAQRLGHEHRASQPSRRHGAAHNGHTDNAEGRRPRFAWHKLLGLDPFASPIRRRYLLPFGNVRALFVALDPCLDSPRLDDGTPLDFSGLAGHAPWRLRIDHTPTHSVFQLKEPLFASLLRIGPFFRGELNDEEQLLFLRALTVHARQSLPGALVLTGGGRTAASRPEGTPERPGTATSARLDTAEGAALFSTGCEALLRSVTDDPKDDAPGTSLHLGALEGIVTTFPFLSSITFAHHLVNAFPVTFARATSTDGSGCPTASTHRDRHTGTPSHISVPFLGSAPLTPVVVRDRHEAYDREERETAWRARLDRASRVAEASSQVSRLVPANASDNARIGAVGTQTYESFAEPALLLGLWTHTLLFCAPIIADVLPLRAHLLSLMQCGVAHTAQRHRCVAEGEEEDTVVHDIDIFHVDYVAFNLARRCRLFGVRAWFSAKAEVPNTRVGQHGGIAVAARHEHADSAAHRTRVDERLQSALRQYAANPIFFPLWTYNTEIPASPPAAGVPRLSAPYRFTSVAEWLSPATPTTVERRLFAMATAMYRPLHLARGSRVVLHSVVPHVLYHSGEARVLPAGTVCVVTDFVDAACALPVAEQTPRPTPVEADADVDVSLPELYLQQQRRPGSRHLPVVRALFVPKRRDVATGVFTPVPVDERREFVLLPQPLLVGGYRSVHYYSLPLLHLPCHILAGGEAVHPPAGLPKRKPGAHGCDAANTQFPASAEEVSFAYAAPLLCHPYHGGRTCLSVLCLTKERKETALAELFSDCSEPTGVSRPPSPLVFCEDMLFSPAASACYHASDRCERSPSSNLAGTAGAAAVMLDGADSTHLAEAPLGDRALSDPFLTELALFRISSQ